MKILMLLSRVPDTLEKGDKLRAFEQLKYLSKEHEIHLFCVSHLSADQHRLERLKPYCQSVTIVRISGKMTACMAIRMFLTGKPLQSAYFYHPAAQKKFDQLVKTLKPDVLYCQLIRMAPYTENISIPKVLDYQDAFSQGMKRRADKANRLMKWIYLTEYRRLKKSETYFFDRFDEKTIISEPDKQSIAHPKRQDINVIKNGVDFDKFKPTSMGENIDILFTGNLAYPPNVDAARWLVKNVLPLLLTKWPDIKIYLVGANPTAKVRKLDSKYVVVMPFVPDIWLYYDRATLFVAPMQLGTGLQNKLLEAMAMKKACITTDLANNALGAINHHDVMIANTPQAFAEAIDYFLSHPDERKMMAENGFLFVKAHYHWDTENRKLEQLLKNTLQSK